EDHFALVEPVRGADRIAVRHQEGRLVAVVEIISPGDKASGAALRGLVETMVEAITRRGPGLVIDPSPPGPHDPQGIHKAIWDALEEEEFELPSDRPLIAASYDLGPLPVTYVEPMAVGDVLPEMPLFLVSESYVPAPLESSYQ